MKKQELKFHFHNPNSGKDTFDFVFKTFIEVNQKKVERAIAKACSEWEENEIAVTKERLR